MSTIHFVGGEKGGVGKSCVARLLAQHFIDQQICFTVRDGDQSHGDMLRFYADYSRPVNFETGDELDGIFEAALETDQQVLVDLPAQSERLLKRWIDDSGLLELANREGVSLVFWHVMDDGRNSVALLDNLIDHYGEDDGVAFVVVKNLGRGIDFSHFDRSQACVAAGRHGAHTLTLAELDRKVMNKIDRLDLSFWAAANLQRGQSLSRMERQRVRVWLRRWQDQLETIEHLLGAPAGLPEVLRLQPMSA